jgi:hypothetical protein
MAKSKEKNKNKSPNPVINIPNIPGAATIRPEDLDLTNAVTLGKGNFVLVFLY